MADKSKNKARHMTVFLDGTLLIIKQLKKKQPNGVETATKKKNRLTRGGISGQWKRLYIAKVKEKHFFGFDRSHDLAKPISSLKQASLQDGMNEVKINEEWNL